MLAPVLIVGAMRVKWHFVDHRFQAVTEGVLYQSAVMPPEELVELAREHGIRTVIDLRKEPAQALMEERAALERAGVRYVNLPTPQVPSNATVAAFLKLMAEPDALPALVHCRHGQGRSVLFAALYRIEFEGWENERARAATSWFPWRGNFAPGSEKGAYLRAYQRRIPGGSH